MSKQIGRLVGLGILAAVFSTVAAENHWIQSAGGDWSNAANWSLGTVPDSGDAVVIDAGGDYAVNVTSAATAASIRVDGSTGTPALRVEAEIQCGQLTVETNASLVTDTGAYLNSHLVLRGNWDWHDGTIMSGRVEANATVNILGTTDKVPGSLENYGQITWNCSGAWLVPNGTSFTNFGTIAVSSANFSLQGGGGDFHNHGSLIPSAEMSLFGSGNFYNLGSIIAANNVWLSSWDSWTIHNSGTFLAENGATLGLNGTFQLNDGTRFSGPGQTRMQGSFGGTGTVVVTGSAELGGTMVGNHVWTGAGLFSLLDSAGFSGSTVFSNDFHVNFQAGTVSMLSGSVTNRGVFANEQGTFSGSGGEFHNEGTLVLSSEMNLFGHANFYNSGTIVGAQNCSLYSWDSWTIHNTGTFHAENGATLGLHGTFQLNDGTKFSGPGQTRMQGSFGGTGTVLVTGSAELGGTMVGNHVWTGAGLLSLLDGAGFSGSTLFSNDFHLNFQSGTVSMLSGSVTNRGVFANEQGTFHGSGGEFHNEGTLVLSSEMNLFGYANFYNSGTIVGAQNCSLYSWDSWTIHNSGAFHAENGATLGLHGTFQLNDGTKFSGPGHTRMQGSFGGTGTVVVDGSAELGGTMVGNHVWTGAGLLSLLDGAGFSGSTVFSNDFHVNFQAGTVSMLSGSVTNRGVFANEQGTFHGSGGEFHNEGSLVLSFEMNLFGNANFYNSGTIVGTQNCSLYSWDSWTIHNRGTFHAESGATLSLNGTFQLNDGTKFSGPGQTRMNGSYGGSGTVAVDGSAELGGTLVGHHVWTGQGLLSLFDGGGFAGSTLFSNDFHVRFDAGTFSVLSGGLVTNRGTFTCENGTVSGQGGMFHNEGVLIVNSELSLYGNGNLYNSGTVRPGFYGSLRVWDNWTVHNSGILHAEQENSALVLSGAFMLNDGTRITGAGRTVLDGGPFGGLGTIVVNGTVEFNGTLTGNHVWSGPGTLFSFNGGAFAGTTVFSNDFRVHFHSGFIDLPGTVTNRGTFGIMTGVILGNNGTFHNEGTFAIGYSTGLGGSGNFYNSGTLLAPEDNLTVTLDVSQDWAFHNTGTFRAEDNSFLELYGAMLLNDGTQFTGPGPVRLYGTYGGSGTIAVNDQATLGGTVVGNHTWSGPGVLSLAEAATFASSTLFSNDFHISLKNGNVALNSAITNRGTFTCETGIILGSSGDFYNEGLFVNDGASYFGGDLYNSGILSLKSGTLAVEGTYSPTSAAIHQFAMAGTSPGSGYPQLLLGALTAAGELKVVQTNGFEAAEGDTFDLIVYSTVTGTFDTVQLPDPLWRSSYESDRFVVARQFAGAPSITVGLENLTVLAGTNVTLSIEASGVPAPTYYWTHNGSIIPGATSATLSLTNVQKASAQGLYRVYATNFYGSARSYAYLVVQEKPFILSQPADQTVVLGDDATFVVEAEGDAPMSYQWFFKNVAIGNATDASFTREDVHASHRGDYLVVVSNPIGAVTSAVAKLSISYTNNPFFAASGVYNGLFHETDEVRQNSAGYFTMTLRTNASFSGKVLLDGNSVSFSGKFPPNGQTNRTVLRTRLGKAPVTFDLQVDFGVNQVVGTVSSSNWIANVLADQLLFSNTNLATNIVGKYTFLIPGAEEPSLSPSGFGYGVVTVRTNGKLSFSGHAADQHVIKQSTVVSKQGKWPLFSQMYVASSNVPVGAITVTNRDYRGFMLGWLSLTNASTNSPAGTISWVKTPWTNQLYASGFTNDSEILGSIFQTPPKGTRVASITNGVASFFDGNLSSPVSYLFGLKTNNSLVLPARTNFSLSISTSAGSFKGIFRDPATGATAPFYGALLQEQNFGAGFFLRTNHPTEGGLMQLQNQ